MQAFSYQYAYGRCWCDGANMKDVVCAITCRATVEVLPGAVEYMR